MIDSNIDAKYLRIFCDTPTEDARYFNFENYVIALRKIIEFPENSTPLSIVVNGKWGSGKTSLLKSLRADLDDRNRIHERAIKTVWFNAWKYSETDSMLAALIREIFDELERNGYYSDKAKIWLIKGSEQANRKQMISDCVKVISGGLSPDLTKWQKDPAYKNYLPFSDEFQKYLNTVLSFFVKLENGKVSDKNGVLVIFIDDLDRCSPKSVAKILEAINLFFDQTGCIFVFGMDTNLISKAVEDHYCDHKWFSGESYLKKMIQLQLDLPEIRKDDLKEFIRRELDSDELLKDHIVLILECTDSNPRQIKQFINSLRLMLILNKTIERLNIVDELLIKWSILNLVSSDFVGIIKHDHELLFRAQAYARLNETEFSQWDRSQRPNFFEKTAPEIREKERVEFETIINNNIKALKILRHGTELFTDTNFEDCIFLSSIAPKEPMENNPNHFKSPAEEIIRKKIENQIGLSNLKQAPFSVLFVDIDDFKKYNETYGYDNGNHLIDEVGNLLDLTVRKVDNIFRFFGDEIIIISELGTDIENSIAFGNRIRKTIENNGFFLTSDSRVNITISCGIATYSPDRQFTGEIARLLLYEASHACSRAKALGKNQVVHFDQIS
jgi:diguanylate cyclase (GGDEF)-like protein